MTAVYKGTNPKTGSSILLRSYDSRKEPPPEFNCTIWQAGRATSATGLAFKPIKIGQSVFVDEGAGRYNPSPQLLEEAVVNEWPGRELGIFVSIGTGKRPGSSQNTHEWWEGFVGGSMGNFAEARRRLIAKIEDCEDTHIQMMNVDLPRRGVPLENYSRFNVEVGVGEFGMNEWERLSDMTINTKKYLKKTDTQKILGDTSYKLAKIELIKRRMDHTSRRTPNKLMQDLSINPQPEQQSQHEWPDAVELPAEMPTRMPNPVSQLQQQHYRSSSSAVSSDYRTSSQDKFMVVPDDVSSHRISAELASRSSHEDYRYGSQLGSQVSQMSSQVGSQHAPPVPPKTPINDSLPPIRTTPLSPTNRMSSGMYRPPYPDMDGPPPTVNKLRKPEYIPR